MQGAHEGMCRSWAQTRPGSALLLSGSHHSCREQHTEGLRRERQSSLAAIQASFTCR